MAARTSYRSHILRRDRRIWIRMRLDGVNAMTIRTHRRLPVPPCHRLPVNALLELFGDRIVTLPACQGHVELENRRLRVPGVQDFMRAMTVGADRGLL